MTDRELLELAAKAAGIELDWGGPPKSWPWRMTGSGDDRGPAAPWNSLHDDGDALRLAVKLEIRASVSGTKAIADWWVRPAMTSLDNEIVAIEGDPCAALRRAITQAAAEIGKAMP